MPTAIAFQIQQVHDKADRRRVFARRDQLMKQYSAALGGMHALEAPDRVDIEIAAELIAMTELGRDRVDGSSELGDSAALKRLEEFAARAVAKLALPADFASEAKIKVTA
jgi:hypothetical protein